LCCAGAKNIEPVPIEQRLGESAFIQQAVVLGQDQKYLAALIVPRQEALIAWAEENEIPFNDYPSLLDQPEVKELIDSEINSLVSMKMVLNLSSGFSVLRCSQIPSNLDESFPRSRRLSDLPSMNCIRNRSASSLPNRRSPAKRDQNHGSRPHMDAQT